MVGRVMLVGVDGLRITLLVLIPVPITEREGPAGRKLDPKVGAEVDVVAVNPVLVSLVRRERIIEQKGIHIDEVKGGNCPEKETLCVVLQEGRISVLILVSPLARGSMGEAVAILVVLVAGCG